MEACSVWKTLLEVTLLVKHATPLALLFLWLADSAAAQPTFYGDVRLRIESDWHSTTPTGTRRPDRDRLRARFRLGLEHEPVDGVTIGARLRSGSRLSQQSPHVTFGDDFRPKDINLDKVFVEAKTRQWWTWGGKNEFPFWTQNELFWDADVTPEGVAGGWVGDAAAVTGGVFVLDETTGDTPVRFGHMAKLVAGQALLRAGGRGVQFQGSAGFFDFRDNPERRNRVLGDLDYGLWVLSARVRQASWRMSVGVDMMVNVEDYPTNLHARDQTQGFVWSLHHGNLDDKNRWQRGDWRLGYTYAHIGQYAVVAFLAQDDWVRWGSATQTRSSNFAGHELRGEVAVAHQVFLVARAFMVKGVVLHSPDAVALEDGNRFRLDLDISF